MEFLYEYGLFLAKAATTIVTVAIVLGLIASSAMSKGKSKKGELELTSLSEKYQELKEGLEEQLLTKEQLKQHKKALKKQRKQEKKAAKQEDKDKQPSDKGRLFVLNFKGSVDAHEVEALREEISAILAVADKQQDEVLLKLESGGGVVHGYGLAASQLNRLRQAEIPVTACVDKIAASGGYMMACVANQIIAAPFAIIGSIGVIAQIPNFHRLLKKHDIDFEQVTAGEYKRTLTMFGENTEHGREKFKQEIEEVHELFKQFVEQFRPELDLAKVATGEHWFASKAHELGLVDALNTSDDYLMAKIDDKDIYKVQYVTRKKLADKFAENMSLAMERMVDRLWQRSRSSY